MELTSIFQYLEANGGLQDFRYLQNVFSPTPFHRRQYPGLIEPFARPIDESELLKILEAGTQVAEEFTPETKARIATATAHLKSLVDSKANNEGPANRPPDSILSIEHKESGDNGLIVLEPALPSLKESMPSMRKSQIQYFPSLDDPEIKLYMDSIQRPQEVTDANEESAELKHLKKMQAREAKSKRCNPAKMADVLAEAYSLRICRDMIMGFDGSKNHYCFHTKKSLLRLIKSAYSNIITEVGCSSLLFDIYNFILCNKLLACDDTWFRQSYDLIAFSNGTFHLVSEDFFPPSAQFSILNSINHRLILRASDYCPQFDAFLQTIAGNDPILIQRIWEVIGYCLSNDLNGRAMILFQGVSASGKSTLAKFIISLFSAEAIQAIQLDDISNNFAAHSLFGKALVVSLDLPNTVLNEKTVGLLKSMSGNDLISSDVKYGERHSFYATWKVLIASNSVFSPRKPDDAFMKRIVVIPFRYTIFQGSWDLNLLEKFEVEKNAIILRSLQALKQLRQNKYIFSGSDRYKVNEVLETMNDTAQQPQAQNKSVTFAKEIENFINARYAFTEKKEDFCFLEDLYTDFCFQTNNEDNIDCNLFSKIFFSLFSACVDRGRTRVNSSDGTPKAGFYKIKKIAKQR